MKKKPGTLLDALDEALEQAPKRGLRISGLLWPGAGLAVGAAQWQAGYPISDRIDAANAIAGVILCAVSLIGAWRVLRQNHEPNGVPVFGPNAWPVASQFAISLSLGAWISWLFL